jgi:hypothetical protein
VLRYEHEKRGITSAVQPLFMFTQEKKKNERLLRQIPRAWAWAEKAVKKAFLLVFADIFVSSDKLVHLDFFDLVQIVQFEQVFLFASLSHSIQILSEKSQVHSVSAFC